ncbi:MAG: hypothetical protein ACRDS0_16470 [Pseudonocardiaceae bacterium]
MTTRSTTRREPGGAAGGTGRAPPSNSTPPPRPRGTPATRLRPLLAAALIAPSIVALGALTTPAVAHADFGDTFSRSFGYTGGSQSFVVPDGVAFVDITADGGEGGDGAVNGSLGAAGGAAGRINRQTPGQTW